MIRKKFQGGSSNPESYFTYDPDALGGVQTQVERFAPFVESSGRAFLPTLEKTAARALSTQDLNDLFRGVVPQTGFQQDVIQQQLTQAGLGQATFGGDRGTLTNVGAGTGISAFEPFIDEAQRLSGAVGPQGQVTAAGLQAAREPFMSPFQQQVIDATRASFENRRAQDRLNIGTAAAQANAFGGARQGVQEGVYDAQTALGIAELEAGIRQQNFQQADAARQAEMANQQALASSVPGLQTTQLQGLQNIGLGQQALEQQQRQILESQARERIFDPQQRAGFFSQIYSPLVGSFGPQSRYTVDSAPPPNPLQTITGIGGLGVGLLGGLGNLLGGG